MFKNVASQKVAIFAWDNANGQAKTGDSANITAQISLDGAATAATNDTNPTELDATDAPGIYLFDMTQAETNADLIVLAAVSSTSDIDIRPVIIYTNPLTPTLIANLPPGVAKNTALSNFEFLMIGSDDHVTPAKSRTVTGQISQDGGAFADLTNSVSEVGSGVYKVNLTAAEMNAGVVTLVFTGPNCDQRTITIKTSA